MNIFQLSGTNIIILLIVGKIIISILPAISCQGMTKEDVPNLLEKTKLLMDTHFADISKETQPTK